MKTKIATLFAVVVFVLTACSSPNNTAKVFTEGEYKNSLTAALVSSGEYIKLSPDDANCISRGVFSLYDFRDLQKLGIIPEEIETGAMPPFANVDSTENQSAGIKGVIEGCDLDFSATKEMYLKVLKADLQVGDNAYECFQENLTDLAIGSSINSSIAGVDGISEAYEGAFDQLNECFMIDSSSDSNLKDLDLTDEEIEKLLNEQAD